jgi:condensation enzyme
MSGTVGAQAKAPAERIPLSLNQEFVCLFDGGDDDGPFGPHYHIVEAWRVSGPVDTDALRRALLDVVTRHEALRTILVRDGDEKYQKIEHAVTPELIVRDLPDQGTSRDDLAESLIRELEAGTIDPAHPPFLRAVLARFDDRDAVLALQAHHLATDGWSVRVLIRDLANRYAAQQGCPVPGLPDAPRYREFAAWQRTMSGAEVDAHRKYWREKLAGARISAIPTDFPRSAALPQLTAAHRFAVPAGVASSVARLATATRASKPIIMLAAYALVVAEATGSDDVVIATFTPGRGGRLFQEAVGSFFNFIPLRISVAQCRSFGDVLLRTRQTCLDAYSHDIPSLHIFAEAPDLMGPAMSDTAAAAVFQVFPDPVLLGDDTPGGLKYTEISRCPGKQERTSATPDGMLWTLSNSPAGEVLGSTVYKPNLFRADTIAAMTDEFQRRLGAALSAPDAPLSRN